MVSEPNVNGNGRSPTPLPNLTPRHLADLRNSGLSDATIAACRFASISDPKKIREILNWNSTPKLGVCLAFPFVDAEGKLVEYESRRAF
jgi:hypothetical protein